MISECLICGMYGKNEDGVIVWYRKVRGKLVVFAREIWPHTSPCPYCPKCWAGILEKREERHG